MNPVFALAPFLTQTAVRHCLRMQIPMVIALADAEGELLHFTRMEGSLPASRAIAINKAYTAAALRMPTHELGPLCQPGQELYGIQHALDGRAVLFGGGFPLLLDGRILGAIGISGGTVAQDMEVAAQALDLWEGIAKIAGKLRQTLPQETISALCGSPQTIEHVCGSLASLEPVTQELLAAAIRLLPLLTGTAEPQPETNQP